MKAIPFSECKELICWKQIDPWFLHGTFGERWGELTELNCSDDLQRILYPPDSQRGIFRKLVDTQNSMRYLSNQNKTN
jgi:hypothetical protein